MKKQAKNTFFSSRHLKKCWRQTFSFGLQTSFFTLPKKLAHVSRGDTQSWISHQGCHSLGEKKKHLSRRTILARVTRCNEATATAAYVITLITPSGPLVFVPQPLVFVLALEREREKTGMTRKHHIFMFSRLLCVVVLSVYLNKKCI